MTTQLVQIPEFKMKATLPSIEFNYDEVKEALDKHLETYSNVLVTIETLADDKKLATELNKQAEQFKRARIDKAKELSAPISAFEEKLKALEKQTLDVRAKINDQVKAFEHKRLNVCAELLEVYANSQRDERGIEQRYRISTTEHLVKLGSLTAKDALTKTARDAVDVMVESERHKQDKVSTRLVMLENASLKAGLDAPLTRENVEAFLYSDNDEDYDSRLTAIIDSELRRQEQSRAANEARIAAENAARENAERERIEAEQAKLTQPEAATETHESGQPVLNVVTEEQRERVEKAFQPQPQEAQPQETQPHPAPQEEPEQNGLRTVTVQATFTVQVPSYIQDVQITAKLRSLLESAGITTLTSVEVAK